LLGTKGYVVVVVVVGTIYVLTTRPVMSMQTSAINIDISKETGPFTPIHKKDVHRIVYSSKCVTCIIIHN
jgi:hypothetical protein